MFLQIDVSHGQLLFKKRRKPLCLSRLKYFCWVIHPSFQLAVKLQNTSRKLGGNLRICTLLSALALAKCLGSSLYFFSYIHSRNLSRLAKTSRTAGQKVFRGVREREEMERLRKENRMHAQVHIGRADLFYGTITAQLELDKWVYISVFNCLLHTNHHNALLSSSSTSHNQYLLHWVSKDPRAPFTSNSYGNCDSPWSTHKLTDGWGGIGSWLTCPVIVCMCSQWG